MNIKQYLFLPLYIVIGLISNLSAIYSVSAQVTSDGTTGTTVNADGNNFEINDGTRNGGNLFHSFQDFSVPDGGSASFNNAVDVDNILSRVTGGNISNIDGLIRANGNANLFLINPAGIIFGESARLDVGGSFYGSTADSVFFEDGEFSAVNNLDAPILTINAPIGLNFRDNPSPIINRSFVQNNDGEFVGLEVRSGNTIGLVGGDINFEAGEATASGGQIELGGLSSAGTVTIEPDGSLTFPNNVTKANASFSNAARVDVEGTGGGSISVYANDLEISGGEFGGSIFIAGITADSTSIDAQAGDIYLNAQSLSITGGSQIQNSVLGSGDNTDGGKGNTGNVIIEVTGNVLITGISEDNFNSGIFSDVEAEAEGNAGDIIVSANSFSLTEGAFLSSPTSGKGNAGNIILNIGDTVEITNSNLFSNVQAEAEGNAGNITINANSFSLTEGALLDSSTSGNGNAGDITINSNNLELVAGNMLSDVFEPARGMGGNITLTGQSISLTNESLIGTGTFPNTEEIGSQQLQAGNIELNVSESLRLSEGTGLSSQTLGTGNAGNVTINGLGANIVFEGLLPGEQNLDSSGLIFSSTNSSGDAGDILITAKSLSLQDKGVIDSSNFGGAGNAGNTTIKIAGNLNIVNSNISSTTSANENDLDEGNAGSINITAKSLSLLDGATLFTSTSSDGDGGNISLNVSDSINIDRTLDGQASAGIFNSVGQGAVGNGGTTEINTTNLSITNGGFIDAITSGQGNSGSVSINASESVTLDGTTPDGESSSAISTSVFQGAVGDGNRVEITTPNLSINNGAGIFAGTSGQGSGGSVLINASESVTLDGTTPDGESSSAISTSVFQGAVGDGGSVEITTPDLLLADGAGIFATTSGQGNGGNLIFNIGDRLALDGNSTITAQAAETDANGGNIFINAQDGFVIAFPSQNEGNGNDISAFSNQGAGGNITIEARGVFGIEERANISGNNTNDIDASGEVNNGNVEIITPNADAIEGTTELSTAPVEPGETIAQACSGQQGSSEGNLVVRGSGIPQPPTAIFDSTIIAIGQINEEPAEEVKPILTSQGEIIPAQGVVVKENGEIILTAYKTNNNSRVQTLNCNPT